jgi:hypothetical protein
MHEVYPQFKAQARRTEAAIQPALREVQDPRCLRSRRLSGSRQPRAPGLGEALSGAFGLEAEDRLMVIDGDNDRVSFRPSPYLVVLFQC